MTGVSFHGYSIILKFLLNVGSCHLAAFHSLYFCHLLGQDFRLFSSPAPGSCAHRVVQAAPASLTSLAVKTYICTKFDGFEKVAHECQNRPAH